MKIRNLLTAAIAIAMIGSGAEAATVRYYARAGLSKIGTPAAPTPSYTYNITGYGQWSACTQGAQTRAVTSCTRSDGQTAAVSSCTDTSSLSRLCPVQCATLVASTQPTATSGWVQLSPSGNFSSESARLLCTDYVNNAYSPSTPGKGLCYWNSTTGEVREYNYGTTKSATANIWASACQ